MSYLPLNTATTSTTDGSAHTLATIPVPQNVTFVISALVIGRRTGGSAGSANDGAVYRMIGSFYNTAGTASVVIQGNEFTAESQTAWNASFSVSGANALIEVNGATNNNVNWAAFWDTDSVA